MLFRLQINDEFSASKWGCHPLFSDKTMRGPPSDTQPYSPVSFTLACAHVSIKSTGCTYLCILEAHVNQPAYGHSTLLHNARARILEL